MSFSQFFINRPIFAGVISIIITLAGLIASQVLPVAQYPEIAPPTVVINASYPGANAETLARTVAAPIEEQLSGVENLTYFSSTAATNGTLTIACTFEVGSNADKAVIDVNNRVAIALPRLPDVVRQTGVDVPVTVIASLSGSLAATANVTGAFSALVRVPGFVIAGARFV